MIDRDDVELMLRFKEKRDKKAFAELVRRHQKPLVNFFYKLVWNVHTAEDLTQEVFIKLVKGADTYQATAKFTTFLYKIARNTWIDKLRKDRRKRAVSLDQTIDEDKEKSLKETVRSADPGPDEIAGQKELVIKIKKVLTRLSEEQRVIITLNVFKTMSYREIAEVLDIPVGTVKSRMHQAIIKLREIL